MGQCQGFLMLLVKCTGELANAFLKLFYLRIILGWIARTIFGRFLCVRHFATKDPDFELHVFLGRKVIGRYVSREARWHIDRPFRALVDIQRLSCLSSAKGYPVK
jgi:hypothetical protein